MGKLVLSRKLGESLTMIVQASDGPTLINVEVRAVRGNRASICCDADIDKVKILRNEIQDKAERKQLKQLEQAAQTPEQVKVASDEYYRQLFDGVDG
jgi:sRNA-binding carbon storage regulator CsrA